MSQDDDFDFRKWVERLPPIDPGPRCEECGHFFGRHYPGCHTPCRTMPPVIPGVETDLLTGGVYLVLGDAEIRPRNGIGAWTDEDEAQAWWFEQIMKRREP